jgi:hypothetical protein
MKARATVALLLAVLAVGATAVPSQAAAPRHNHATAVLCFRHLDDSPRPWWFAPLCGGYWWAR